MARMSLPPGFRFHPTNVELVKYYLKRKTLGKKLQFEAIAELNIYEYSPWDLPDKSCLKAKDLEWYFFCPKKRKYASGARSNRATESGYWKSTGKDRAILHNEQTVGMVKTLVFHQGHAPKGERTDWVMHEYRILDKELSDLGVAQDAYVLCKVFKKSGPGPKNGAQYGAPFDEKDWDDDDNEMCPEYPPSDCLPQSSLPCNSNSVVTSMFFPGSTSTIPLSEPGPSKAPPPAEDVPPPTGDDEDITTLMEMFTEDGSVLLDQSSNNKVENLGGMENCDGLTRSDVDEIFNSLVDLDNRDYELPGVGLNFSCEMPTTGYGVQPMLGGDGNNDGHDVAAYVELNDLNSPLYFTASGSGPKHGFTETTVEPNFFSNVEQHHAAFDDFIGAVQHNNIFLP